jgi:hypothetical protein
MGRVLALVICVCTVILVVVGTLWPAGMTPILGTGAGAAIAPPAPPGTPQAAARDFMVAVQAHDWREAYQMLANKDEFSEADLARDLGGEHGSLRTHALLQSFETQNLRQSADEALLRVNMNWSTVVGGFHDAREVKAQKSGDEWKLVWPIAKSPKVPPQVIPVNYLRWDVVYRGAGDDWGVEDVEAPHVRIVAMNPIQRPDGLVVLGEILNEDTVPAWISVKATLLNKAGEAIAKESSFDKVSHTLLPKQVSPFRIDFPGIKLPQVDSIRMDPSATLVGASADPVIEIQGQKIVSSGTPSLSGELSNQSGQVVSISHVLATFYSKNSQIVWVADSYVDRALLPRSPVPFQVNIPPDVAPNVASFRVIASPYSEDR